MALHWDAGVHNGPYGGCALVAAFQLDGIHTSRFAVTLPQQPGQPVFEVLALNWPDLLMLIYRLTLSLDMFTSLPGAARTVPSRG